MTWSASTGTVRCCSRRGMEPGVHNRKAARKARAGRAPCPLSFPFFSTAGSSAPKFGTTLNPWPSAGPVSCRRILCQSLHLRSTGRCVFSICSIVPLVVLGFTLFFASAVCHRFVGPCCHQFMFSYGFIFETMAYSCNVRCPIVSSNSPPPYFR